MIRKITAPKRKTKFLVFDVETTGLLPKNTESATINDYPYIIQFSFVIYDLEKNETIKSYDSYIKIPETVEIPEFISKLTGITNKICETCGVSIIDAIRHFHEAYIMCDGLVAHNMDFDKTMIEIEMERNRSIILEKNPECFVLFNKTYETINKIDRFCTMKNGKNICNIFKETIKDGEIILKKSAKFPKLAELYEKLFDETPENLHNSMVDVSACLRCYLKMRHFIG